MKRCTRCERRKPLRAYYADGRGYHRHVCKACVNEQWHRLGEESKAWIRDHCRRWFRKHQRMLASATDFVSAPPRLTQYYRLQHDTIMAYGGYRCACCGIDEPFFLTIDHVDGHGVQHRRKTGTGCSFYKWLRDKGYPEGFQVLCSNCNSGRHRNGGVCPHKYRASQRAKTRRRKVSRVRAPRRG